MCLKRSTSVAFNWQITKRRESIFKLAFSVNWLFNLLVLTACVQVIFGLSNRAHLSSSQMDELIQSSPSARALRQPPVTFMRIRSTCSGHYLRPVRHRSFNEPVLAASAAANKACSSADSCARAAAVEIFQLQYWTWSSSYRGRIPQKLKRRGWRWIVSLGLHERIGEFVCSSRESFLTVKKTNQGSRNWSRNCLFLLMRADHTGTRLRLRLLPRHKAKQQDDGRRLRRIRRRRWTRRRHGRSHPRWLDENCDEDREGDEDEDTAERQQTLELCPAATLHQLNSQCRLGGEACAQLRHQIGAVPVTSCNLDDQLKAKEAARRNRLTKNMFDT